MKEWETIKAGNRQGFDSIKININSVSFSTMFVKNNKLLDFSFCKILYKDKKVGFLFLKERKPFCYKLNNKAVSFFTILAHKLKQKTDIINGYYPYKKLDFEGMPLFIIDQKEKKDYGE